MTRARNDRCDHCKYYKRESPAYGKCLRYPPPGGCEWPTVGSDNWCGEFQKRENK